MRLQRADLMLIFTPELCENPEGKLRRVWADIDVIQVRPKGLGEQSNAPSSARDAYDWANKILEIANSISGPRPLILINDRVDVARALANDGIDGVHLGQNDTPPRIARETLGPRALIGLSTHNFLEVRDSTTQPIDYLGFGAVFPTATKSGTTRNQATSSWVASAHMHTSGLPRPVFPIGGIGPDNAWLLSPNGRAAVGSGILSQDDPQIAAKAIRRALSIQGRQRRGEIRKGLGRQFGL